MKRFKLLAVLAAAGLCSAAQAEDDLTIGVHASFSGAGAAFAEGMLAATNFAAEDVNKDGGLEVAGKRYKVVIKQYDDRYRAQDAVTAMDRLMIQDGIHFVVGPMGSAAWAQEIPPPTPRPAPSFRSNIMSASASTSCRF
jgi:branched-chain amino acid transport system substrate-binding protein